MQRRLHFYVAALAAVIAAGSWGAAVAQEVDARATIAARQQVRTELADAMSDGKLTRMEEYTILLHAKDKLSSQDLQGVERTLDRLATKQQAKSQVRQVRQVSATADAGPLAPVGDPATMSTDGGMIETTPFQEEGVVEGGDPQCDDDACPWEGPCSPCGPGMWGGLWGLNLSSTVDAFKGPMDINNLNGNFGVQFGVNGAVAVAPYAGIGLQGGSSAVLSDFHGSLFTDNDSRSQQFTTVGMFQRIPIGCGSLNWGFAYDWLIDDYYTILRFGQWRVKIAAELSPYDEVGGWAAIPDHGDSGDAPNVQFFDLHFKPLAQGSIYWRHTWMNQVSTTGSFGIAEEPGEFIFGADTRAPLTSRLALISQFSYILPSAQGGFEGQSDEFWNVSVGLEFVPGRKNPCGRNLFSPFMPVADNGSFAVRLLR